MKAGIAPNIAEGWHVLAHPAEAVAAPKVGISYIKRGTTTNFAVYYDGSLATGPTLADALLSSCEWEYSMLRSWFGGITPASLPFNVYIDSGSFGAYHATCLATEIHCAAFSGSNADLVRLVLAAEVDEVFMAAQAKGWNCGFSHGEGLSRVLATELYPAELDGFASAATWLDGARPNWVDTTDPTDRVYTSIGCAVLFLNFLRYELTYSWNAIVAAAAPTLAGVYQKLTSQTDGWARFSALMQAYYPKGSPSGVTTDNPFPLTRHSGSMIQGRYGDHGNFEVVEPASVGGLVHFWRNNDVPPLPWSGPTAFGAVPLGKCTGATVIESNFEAPGLPGNLEVAAVTIGGHLEALWRDSGPAFVWSLPVQVATSGVKGQPALIQGKFGVKGNFELVVPSASGGLLHFWRNNDIPAFPWSTPTTFGASLGSVDAVALIQSNFGKPGNLEVIARVGAKLYALWRDSGPAFAWSTPVQIANNVAGQPSFIQSRFGAVGNFELVVPSAGGGLLHFWRNNDVPALPWSAPTAFGSGAFTDTTVIESNFGDPGNLEVLARTGNKLVHFWRDSAWNGPDTVASSI